MERKEWHVVMMYSRTGYLGHKNLMEDKGLN